MRLTACIRRTPVVLILSLLTAAHVLAIGLFARGFLLTRVELKERSVCGSSAHSAAGTAIVSDRNDAGLSGTAAAVSGADAAPGRNNHAEASCWGRRHYKRSAWVIIDALRFDFVACLPGAAAGCRSRMPQLLELCQTAVSDSWRDN